MEEAVIVEAVRTPIGRKKGKLAGVRPDDLVAGVMKETVRRAGVDPAVVEDVVMGCVTQIGEQGFNIARNAALIAGFPLEVTGTSVNRQCGSSQQAANFAAMAVMSGMHDCVLAAGVESMTRVPMGADGMVADYGIPLSPKLGERFDHTLVPQGISAEYIAQRWKLGRREVDEFSYQSHMKAAAAIEKGHFVKEIWPVEAPVMDPNGQPTDQKQTVKTDEGVRRDTTLEKIASLKPSFLPEGVVTAGSSSQISDGAAALLIMSRKKAKELGVRPRARFVSTALAGVDPVIMLTGPIYATPKALRKAGLTLRDIDLIEINEAFSSVVLAWQKELDVDMKKVNVNGGAVALGHPLGCSGARLLTTLMHEMERRGSRYGLSTMCIGFGQGIATIIERVS
ncbi:MAG: thiolase family protein [Nitrospirae bacterium]|nr:thiolase family protein [Nitrospirota bacterium]